MKYYTISKSNELTVIGDYPQVEKLESYNLSLNDSYWNVSWDRFPNFKPNYQIRIKDKAIPTSLLHSLSGFVGLTINVRLKQFLERYNLPPHEFYSIKVSHLNKRLDYCWFHFIDSCLNYVDFKSTTFELFQKSSFKILKELQLSSVEHFHELEEELNFEKGIRLKRLVLSSNFPNYDIISLHSITPIILVSENLKIELEKSVFNGFEFNEYKPLSTPSPDV